MAETGGGGKAEMEVERESREFRGGLRERREGWGRGWGEKAGGDGHWWRWLVVMSCVRGWSVISPNVVFNVMSFDLSLFCWSVEPFS